MNEILSSIIKWFKDRTASPMYGTFVFSVILWNWKFFYLLFWQSEDKLGLPKIEYIQNNYLNQQTYWQHLLHFLIFPLVSTYVIIWWLPILNNWAFKKHMYYHYQRETIIDSAKFNYENITKQLNSSGSQSEAGQKKL